MTIGEAIPCATMPERRQRDRRSNFNVPEPIERKRERRQGDRRDSDRRKGTFVVRDGEALLDVEGEVGLGGASFTVVKALASSTPVVEVKVGRSTVRMQGKVTKSSGGEVHVRFGELDTETELKLARWLDGVD